VETKKTPLYDEHVKLGGKIVDYAGWFLPVQYEGILVEHEAVRTKAGIFDVSHMGEVMVRGKEALNYLQYLLTNDIGVLENNQVVYTFMCYPDGGVVDDLLTYKINDEEFLLVINASNTDKDFKWMQDNVKDFDVVVENISDKVGEVALQGPNAEKILSKLTDENLSDIKFFHFKKDINVAGTKCLVSRTGYTGEDGFEIYTSTDGIVNVWNSILEAGEEYGIKPAGLGCRDTLRFEAGLPLYGHEISQDISPIQGGFKFFVKLDKDDFIGKDALVAQNENITKKVVGFELLGKCIPREGYDVVADGKKIGYVATGYFAPTLKKNIGTALVDAEYSKKGTEFEVMIRNKPVKAKVIDKRFYKRK